MEYTIRFVKRNGQKMNVEYAEGKDEAKRAISRLANEYSELADYWDEDPPYFDKVQAINERGTVSFSKKIER